MNDVKQQGIIAKATTEKKELADTKPKTLKEWTESMMPQIAKALPKVITPERFTRIALTALSSNPQLAQCSRNSFLGGLMQAAQLGLEPNTPLGQAYLIPFKNNKKGEIECQFQVGYKGLIDLAYRSGEVQTIQAYCVYENDEFQYELGMNPVLTHKPAMGERGKLVCVYAMFKLVNGGYGFEVMSKDDIDKHAKKYSKSFNYGPWQSNYEEMAKKTVLKKVLKYAPIKTEFVQAVATDETTIKMDNTDAPEDLQVEYTVVDMEENEADE